MDLINRFNLLQKWLYEYKELWNIEPLNFHPNKYPQNIQNLILPVIEMNDVELLNLENTWSNNYLNEFFNIRSQLLDIPTYKKEVEISKYTQIGMNTKKRHEIKRLTSFLIDYLKNKNNVLIDAGAGVGHLAFSIIEQDHSKQIFVIDQDQRLIDKGKLRSIKKLKEKRGQIQFKKFDLQKNSYPKFDLLPSVLHGLHSCGDLSLSLLNWFLDSRHENLILTSCCYHKLSQYNISKNAKLEISPHALHLAAKGDNYGQDKDYQKRSLIKEKRYALELYLRSKNIKTKAVGSLPLSEYLLTFSEYAQKYGKMQDHAYELESFFGLKSTKKTIRNLIIAGIIRGAFSKPLELYLILDRAIYLQEKGVKNIKLISLFDREYSPRNITLIAEK